ncbi:Exocyst complex component 6 [Sciurus carolinensis]|uniref:Exocyst complex component 6 n=1 Tax=Sciurus carolinensis TaxID=30640 RepID=A0AA41MQG9_SCICA|nr:Exocyst complex component 6 [Sciurus carolinensis]
MSAAGKSGAYGIMLEEDTDQTYENVLAEIQSFELPIEATLRSVYDDQPNSHKKFMEKLDACIRNHDKEIEKMCNFHHQGFVDAITELLKVRTDAEKLKVIVQTEDIIRCRIQQRNITTVVEKLQLCLPVLEMYSKLKEQMSAKRYYSALKTMEQLENVYFPRVSQYRFCQLMIENLPKLREDIKEISMSDLKDFLESIRKHSDKIGETAMKQVLTVQDLVDFSPVYRCLHIYSVLGDEETFENYYRKQRKKQARLVLQPQSSMHETVDGYRRYFTQIVGFFVVEDHILHVTQGLVTRAYTDELWNMALSKIIAVLRAHSSYCTDPDLVLELKNLIVIFADTLQGYGFPVNRLFDLLFEIRDQYNETLLKKWAGVFRDIFEEDNYSPIPIVSEEEYRIVTSKFPFQDPDLEKLVQIIINTTHLEQACKYLEDFITNITNISQETVHTTRLYGLSTFKDARHAAEGEIYTKLNQKIDEFVQLADYDWTMSEPDGRASGYLMDLINFLRSIFQVFTHLPLLDLFMVWDWSTYLADYGQPASKYLRVNPNTALTLLEKMKDTSKKNNIFAQFRKNDRDKQKLIETVVKQLRSLVNGMSQHT